MKPRLPTRGPAANALDPLPETVFPAGNPPVPEAAIRAAASGAVGHLSLRDAVRIFRDEMVRVAFRLRGSRRGAAKMLSVTRPAVQHVLRQSGVEDASQTKEEIESDRSQARLLRT